VAIENKANSAPLMKTEFFLRKIIFLKLWPIDLWISHHPSLGFFERERTQEQLTNVRNGTNYDTAVQESLKKLFTGLHQTTEKRMWWIYTILIVKLSFFIILKCCFLKKMNI
jgi:hypothetical protein